MRFLVACILLVSSVAVTAQLPNPVPPSALIPSSPDIPRTKLSKWTSDGTRSTVTLQTSQGMLRGYHYAGKDPAAPTILFFNGNNQTINDNDSFYRKLAEQGPAVVSFDYLGYGASSGNADVLSFRADALAVYDQTLEQAPTHKVIVYGYSLGTAIAVYVASKRPVAALILAAPMSTGIEQMRFVEKQMNKPPSTIQVLRVDPDTATILDEVGMIKQSTAPLLVIHGTKDQTVDFAEGREVFAASPSVKKYFVKIEGADHMGLPVQVGAFQSIKMFLPIVEKP